MALESVEDREQVREPLPGCVRIHRGVVAPVVRSWTPPGVPGDHGEGVVRKFSGGDVELSSFFCANCRGVLLYRLEVGSDEAAATGRGKRGSDLDLGAEPLAHAVEQVANQRVQVFELTLAFRNYPQSQTFTYVVPRHHLPAFLVD